MSSTTPNSNKRPGHFDGSVPEFKRTQSGNERSAEEKLPLSHIFMDLAVSLSHRSADNGTGVGCVLVNVQGQILGIGYNGEAKNTPIDDANKNPEELMVHAEVNAIAHSIVNLKKEDIYVFTTRQPCEQCMKALAQYNIVCIFYLVFRGYNSFVAAENKKIPMVQYNSAFDYSLLLMKDNMHFPEKDQRIALKNVAAIRKDGDSSSREELDPQVQYIKPPDNDQTFLLDLDNSNEVHMTDASPSLCKSHPGVEVLNCPTHKKEVLSCATCTKEKRNRRLPSELHVPASMYERWCSDFKIKDFYKKLKPSEPFEAGV